MGTKSEVYFPLYKLTNKSTGEYWEARGLKPVLRLAGLSDKTPSLQLKKSKKWLLEHVEDPLEWDESSYRQGLYKKSKHKYKDYEARKLLRDPLYERRKRVRLNGWKNIDGSQFTAEQHSAMLQQSCEVCGSNHLMCVDHDHKTNIVRGTLCHSCNVSLGFAKDSVEILLKLVEYVNNHKRAKEELDVKD